MMCGVERRGRVPGGARGVLDDRNLPKIHTTLVDCLEQDVSRLAQGPVLPLVQTHWEDVLAHKINLFHLECVWGREGGGGGGEGRVERVWVY